MVKDDSEYYTIFHSHIKSYLVIAYFPIAVFAEHTVHTNCANHEEALNRAQKQHAAMPYSQNGDTRYLILGMCRDASCDCAGQEAMTYCWVNGVLGQWHYDPPLQRKTYVQ